MSPSIPHISPATTLISSSITTPVIILSRITVLPDQKSSAGDIKLSVSDLPMLSCHYIQKGLFFPPPPLPINSLISLLTSSLSRSLSFFPALAGSLLTDPYTGHIFISCTDSGTHFSHAFAPSLTLSLLLPPSSDVPHHLIKPLFSLDGTVSYDGHNLPLASFQLTELGDGAVFLGCTVNHAVVDGTSFWNFFNAWAELSRSPMLPTISHPPDFTRNFFGNSTAVLRFDSGNGPSIAFPVDAPLRERILHFSSQAIRELKSKANAETHRKEGDISSFQSLCGQLWRSVTRARKHLSPSASTTFRMAVNCRRRIVPAVDECYFGNAIQSIATTATVGEVTEGEMKWVAGLLRRSVEGYGDERIRKEVEEWEAAPRCFPLGNPGGAGLTMGSSPRFPMYERNDFGWGRPVAVRSGRANKFDGKMSAFPGREGKGSVDVEVCLTPETMEALLEDEELMYFVSESDLVGIRI